MDARELLLTSDFPIDNLVLLAEGSVSVPNGTSDAISVGTHTLLFTPMPMLVWSNDPDFTVSNSFVDTAAANTWATGIVGQTYLTYATASEVFIQRDNTSGSTKTLYYRVYCFPPSDAPIDSIVPGTADASDPFIINSDYNYLKLYHAGKLTSGSRTYTHNLGYTPRVFKWGVVTGLYTTPIIQMIQADNDPTGSGLFTNGVYANTTEVGWLNPATFDYIEYRIYVDS